MKLCLQRLTHRVRARFYRPPLEGPGDRMFCMEEEEVAAIETASFGAPKVRETVAVEQGLGGRGR